MNTKKLKLSHINKEEHQTLVDSKIIATLEKEFEFLKTEINTKNEIINKFFNNNIRKSNNDIMVGQTRNCDDTFNTSNSQSVCSAGKSEDSLVRFREGNIIRCNPSKRKIDDQLKNIRKEKHKEYRCAGHKSLSLENNKNKENQKQGDNLQDRNAGKNEPKETNSRSHWLSGTSTVVGDSMVNGIDEKRLTQNYGLVMLKFFTFQVQ